MRSEIDTRMNRKQNTIASSGCPRERTRRERRKTFLGEARKEAEVLEQEYCSPERRDHIIRCATRRVSKKSVARKSPLRFEYSRNSLRGLHSPGINQDEKKALQRVIDRDLTDQERLKEVTRQIERARVLPKASSYARHKLQVLEKAKSLLEQRISSQGSQETGDGDELNRLLEELSIS